MDQINTTLFNLAASCEIVLVGTDPVMMGDGVTLAYYRGCRIESTSDGVPEDWNIMTLAQFLDDVPAQIMLFSYMATENMAGKCEC